MNTVPWEMIGAIFGGLTFLLTLLIEWKRLKAIGWIRIIIALVIGVGVFGLIILIPSIFPTPPAPSTVTPMVETVLPTPTGKLLFSEDFESGFANGFSFNVGDWKVVDDSTGNKVLEISSNSSPNASFGPPNFLDGIVEFRFRVISSDYQAQDHLALFGFRIKSTINGNWTQYALSYDPKWSGMTLNYQENSGSFQPVEGISGGGSIQNPEGSWIILRVEAQGKNIKIFIDGNPFITAYDSRDEQGGLFLGALGNLVAQFDDIKIWDLSK